MINFFALYFAYFVTFYTYETHVRLATHTERLLKHHSENISSSVVLKGRRTQMYTKILWYDSTIHSPIYTYLITNIVESRVDRIQSGMTKRVSCLVVKCSFFFGWLFFCIELYGWRHNSESLFIISIFVMYVYGTGRVCQ